MLCTIPPSDKNISVFTTQEAPVKSTLPVKISNWLDDPIIVRVENYLPLKSSSSSGQAEIILLVISVQTKC